MRGEIIVERGRKDGLVRGRGRNDSMRERSREKN